MRDYLLLMLVGIVMLPGRSSACELSPDKVAEIIGVKATTTPDGVVRVGWPRKDVQVSVDGLAIRPFMGLGTWAAFQTADDGAMVMGDTVVFEDEVNPAMDAAFANGLEVTALHNHFLFDEPKVYFMHIGGKGCPDKLAQGVKAIWDAVSKVCAENAQPAKRFDGGVPKFGELDTEKLTQIIGTAGAAEDQIFKVTIGTNAEMHRMKFGGSMGLTTWAAFAGTNELAVVDGDFAMTVSEVQPVLKALRKAGIHIVALHNHMIGEAPAYYFVHFWGKGKPEELAAGFRAALNAQKIAETTEPQAKHNEDRDLSFKDANAEALPKAWMAAKTGQGEGSVWKIVEDNSSPDEGKALAQVSSTGPRPLFNLCVADEPELKDIELQVVIKAIVGKIDQGGGPVWRYQDANNYYIARFNPLENNFRVYKVVDGQRTELDSAEVKAAAGEWHAIRVVHKADHIQCYLNGKLLLDVTDKEIQQPGKIGLWTKADAQTRFAGIKVSGN